jgi:hypothetical protein
MVVRVGVLDGDSAAGLIPLLAKEVEAERIRFDTSSRQLCIEIERNQDEAVVRILNVVERWLGDGGRAPTSIEIGERSYVLGAQGNGGPA